MGMTFDLRGGIFDDSAPRAVADFADELRDRTADAGLERVQVYCNMDFKRPTPYYETQVRVSYAPGAAVVDDRGIVYGPWLEGISPRNHRLRFKGYSMWRRARHDLETAVPRLAQQLLREVTVRLS